MLILGLDERQGFLACGVPDPVKVSADLASWCSTDMEPPLRPLIGIHEFEGVYVVVAEIAELDPSAKPCFYRGAGLTQGTYIRVGDGDRHLSSYEVHLLLSNRSQPRWDEEPVPGTSIDDFLPSLVEVLVSRLRTRRPYAFGDVGSVEALRLLTALVDDGSGAEVASVGGLLALGRFPQARFPQLMLTFVHHPRADGADTTSGERFIDNVVAEGPVPVIVRDALLALHKNMSRRSFVRGAGREDVWEYPAEAVREAVVNALVHRDLSPEARGTHVQVDMYPDRLVVHSPGGLFGGVTTDQLGEDGATSTRNAALLRILEDVPVPGSDRPVCENRGTGIRTMIAALRAARMNPPQFEDRVSRFTVSFPEHALCSPEVVQWIEALGQQGLSDSQCVALAVMSEGDHVDNGSYRYRTGVDSRVATTELRDLIERGLARQVGTRRWARYVLDVPGPGAASEAVRSTTRGGHRDVLMQALDGGELSRAELSRATGLSDPR